jgi:hypothetical protein
MNVRFILGSAWKLLVADQVEFEFTKFYTKIVLSGLMVDFG